MLSSTTNDQISSLHSVQTSIAIWKNLIEWDYPNVDPSLNQYLENSVQEYDELKRSH